MDLIGLLKELTSTGISDFVFIAVALVVVRYWFSETRREISKEIDDKIGTAKAEFQQSFQEIRQEVRAVRTYAEQAHQDTRQEIRDTRTEFTQAHQDTRQEIRDARTESTQAHQDTRQEIRDARTESTQAHQDTRQELKEIMLHLIDVRERLANIEGRLGAPTPRMSGVSPPLEAPAEEPSTQS